MYVPDGSEEALVLLAKYLKHGVGVTTDVVPFKQLCEAAASGHINGRQELELFYLNEESCTADPDKPRVSLLFQVTGNTAWLPVILGCYSTSANTSLVQ